jgi:hypothetical protein
MRHAVVRDGVVENVVEWNGDSEWTPPEGATVVAATDSVGVGWSYDGETFSAPVVQLTLDERRAVKVSAATLEFGARIAAGVAYGGKVLQIGDEDRANITGQSSRAIASLLTGSGVTWPSDFYWRMADNSALELPTAADMLALGQAAADRYAALRLNLGSLKDAIDDAADQAELDAIDVTAGWD